MSVLVWGMVGAGIVVLIVGLVLVGGGFGLRQVRVS